MRHGSIVAIALVLAGTATAALAVTEPRIVNTVVHGRAATQVSERPAQGDALPLRQVVDSLEGRGHTQVTEVEREGDRYEVKATAPDGRRVELYLDARTGEVVKTKVRR